MNKFLSTVAIAIGLIATTNVLAQQADIYPKPQNIAWGNEIAFANTASYTLDGEGDADATALFKERFNTENGKVQVIIGERGDASVAEYENLIPKKAEGYYLSVGKDKVVIAGNDNSGTFYGVQTFIKIASQPNVMCATVTDYPSVPQRGLVEGYYGNPYSEADRMGLLKMFGELKMNVYIYGPKDDAYHKSKWREEYPADLAKKIT
jgi:hyaluronoglucosaminidase